jgi:hypothetical protein
MQHCCKRAKYAKRLIVTTVLCILQGCVLWKNWWPMLTGLMYVLVPMPYLFFGSTGSDYGSSSLASG